MVQKNRDDLKNRDQLKEFFRAGEKPTQEHFANFIESTLNLKDDGIFIESTLNLKDDGIDNLGEGTAKKLTVNVNALLSVNGSFQLNSGVLVEKISIDTTLGGNSDLAIPTERAIKTYTDQEIQKCAKLDGSINQEFNASTLNATTLNASTLNVKGSFMLKGVEVDQISDDANLKGNSKTILTENAIQNYTEDAIKNYTDQEIQKCAKLDGSINQGFNASTLNASTLNATTLNVKGSFMLKGVEVDQISDNATLGGNSKTILTENAIKNYTDKEIQTINNAIQTTNNAIQTTNNAIQTINNAISIHRGKVGIGTTLPPMAKLEVNGSLKVTDMIQAQQGINISVGSTNHINADGAFYRYGGEVFLTVENHLYIRDSSYKGDNADNIKFHFNTNGGHLAAKGSIGVEGQFFIKDGDKWKRGELKDLKGDQNFPSDINLKQKINPISDALINVSKLNPISFYWQDPSYFTKQVNDGELPSFLTEKDIEALNQEQEKLEAKFAQQQYGFIAQEIETVFPNWVSTGDDSYKRLNLTMLPPLIVAAIQELEKKYHDLVTENQNLNMRLRKLEER